MSTIDEVVPVALDGERLDRVVAICTDESRATVRSLIESGDVRVDGAVVHKPSLRLRAGQALRIEHAVTTDRGPRPQPAIAFGVVHVDADLIVIDKPAGLVVHPGAGHRDDTLVSGLVARFPEIATVGEPERPGIVHRLDKDTSGLLLVARSAAAYTALTRLLAARVGIERTYRALVCGAVESPSGVIDAPIGRSARQPTLMAVTATGRHAVTRYHALASYRTPLEATLLSCTLETGRTHQIRVHLAAIGHPVLGDSRYGGRRQQVPVARPFLHAFRLRLAHPVTGAPLEFESPLPADLTEVLQTFAA